MDELPLWRIVSGGEIRRGSSLGSLSNLPRRPWAVAGHDGSVGPGPECSIAGPRISLAWIDSLGGGRGVGSCDGLHAGPVVRAWSGRNPEPDCSGHVPG